MTTLLSVHKSLKMCSAYQTYVIYTKSYFVFGSLKKARGGGCINSGIYIIYIGSRRAIYNDIAASTSGKKLPRAAAVPSGLRPSGTACCPREFSGLGRKKPRLRGYIVGYSPPTPHIYITYISRYRYVFMINIT